MSHRLPTYLSLIALEAALALFVLRRNRHRQSALIGAVPTSPLLLARDVAIAASMWALWLGFSTLWQRMLPSHANQVVSSLLPTTTTERVVWIVLACSAGFAEELAFRGALLRWAEERVGNAALAIAIQAVMFGVVHGYQGIGSMIRIVIYGAFFGAVARWRKSLLPGMIAHAWTDIAAGLLRI